MRGSELEKDRHHRMQELRRAAQEALPTNQALDGAMLFALISSGDGGIRANLLRRALVLRALRALGYSPVDLAAAFHMSVADVEREASASLLADSSIGQDIAARVLDELRETPEPDRAVTPAGNFAVPVHEYVPDPRLAPDYRIPSRTERLEAELHRGGRPLGG